MANNLVTTDSESPLCVSFISSSVGVVTLKEQLTQEKFPNYRIVEPQSISNFIEEISNVSAKGIIVDTQKIASFNPTKEECEKILKQIKIVAKKGKVHFIFGKFTESKKISSDVIDPIKYNAYNLLTGLKSLLNPLNHHKES